MRNLDFSTSVNSRMLYVSRKHVIRESETQRDEIQDMRSITSLKANSQMIDILKTYGNIMHPAVAKIKTVYDHTSIKHVASHHNDILGVYAVESNACTQINSRI